MFEQEIEILNKINKKYLKKRETNPDLIPEQNWAILNFFRDKERKFFLKVIEKEKKKYYFTKIEVIGGKKPTTVKFMFEIDEEKINCEKNSVLFGIKNDGKFKFVDEYFDNIFQDNDLEEDLQEVEF